MENDTLLFFIRALEVEFALFLVFTIGIRNKLARHWQIRIFVSLLSLIAVTFIAFVYFANSHGLIKN